MRIDPTIGRVVLYFPAPGQFLNRCGPQPMAATVVFVHDQRYVNLAVYDHNGIQHCYPHVQLVQEDDVYVTDEHRCEWMSYQKGQAAKTEQLEAKLTKHFEVDDLVAVFDRYNFAVPLKARVVEVAAMNDGIAVRLLESNNTKFPVEHVHWVHAQQLVLLAKPPKPT